MSLHEQHNRLGWGTGLHISEKDCSRIDRSRPKITSFLGRKALAESHHHTLLALEPSSTANCYVLAA
jgi:hypothetical protein